MKDEWEIPDTNLEYQISNLELFFLFFHPSSFIPHPSLARRYNGIFPCFLGGF